MFDAVGGGGGRKSQKKKDEEKEEKTTNVNAAKPQPKHPYSCNLRFTST